MPTASKNEEILKKAKALLANFVKEQDKIRKKAQKDLEKIMLELDQKAIASLRNKIK